MNSWMNSFLILAIFLHLGIYKCHGDVLKVPALDATHKDVLQVLELGAVTFNVRPFTCSETPRSTAGTTITFRPCPNSNYSPFGIDFVGGKLPDGSAMAVMKPTLLHKYLDCHFLLHI